MAIAVLILGTISALFCWTKWPAVIVCGILAIILAIFNLRKTEDKIEIKMSTIGLIAGVIGILIPLSVFIVKYQFEKGTVGAEQKAEAKILNMESAGEESVKELRESLNLQ